MNDSSWKDSVARKNAARAIGRRFATRFKVCGEPRGYVRYFAPPKINFPADLRVLLKK